MHFAVSPTVPESRDRSGAWAQPTLPLTGLTEPEFCLTAVKSVSPTRRPTRNRGGRQDPTSDKQRLAVPEPEPRQIGPANYFPKSESKYFRFEGKPKFVEIL